MFCHRFHVGAISKPVSTTALEESVGGHPYTIFALGITPDSTQRLSTLTPSTQRADFLSSRFKPFGGA